jgi:hypothetical protein
MTMSISISKMDASKKIDEQIAGLSDWRGEVMSRIRKIIHEVDPKIEEEWKWETGIWSHNGMVCAVGVFKDHIKINFFNGAALKDSDRLFNAGLDAKKTRAIDLFEKDKVNAPALKKLIQIAVAYNTTIKK